MNLKKPVLPSSKDSAQKTGVGWGSMNWFQRKYLTQDESSSASYFGHSKNAYQKMRHTHLLELCQSALIVQPSKIVDYGCATGELTAAFAEAWPETRVRGYDFVPDLIIEAKARHSKVKFAVNALPEVEPVAASNTLVILSEVLYYLDEVERKVTLSKLLTSAEGSLTVLFTSVVGERYFTAETAEALFRETGFTPETHIMSLRRYKKIIGICAAYDSVCAKLATNGPQTRRIERLASKLWRIVLFRWIMIGARWFARQICASERLMTFARHLEDTEANRELYPSNIVILARRTV